MYLYIYLSDIYLCYTFMHRLIIASIFLTVDSGLNVLMLLFPLTDYEI